MRDSHNRHKDTLWTRYTQIKRDMHTQLPHDEGKFPSRHTMNTHLLDCNVKCSQDACSSTTVPLHARHGSLGGTVVKKMPQEKGGGGKVLLTSGGRNVSKQLEK